MGRSLIIRSLIDGKLRSYKHRNASTAFYVDFENNKETIQKLCKQKSIKQVGLYNKKIFFVKKENKEEKNLLKREVKRIARSFRNFLVVKNFGIFTQSSAIRVPIAVFFCHTAKSYEEFVDNECRNPQPDLIFYHTFDAAARAPLHRLLEDYTRDQPIQTILTANWPLNINTTIPFKR